MKRVSVILFLFSIVFCLGSCSKNEDFVFNEATISSVTDEQSAFRNMSIALSKVACEYSEIRSFLKSEAIKKIDKDYDVFYSAVKDVKIAEIGSLHDILSETMGGESELLKIESMLPTLSIYVADATWFDPDGFCADNWDTCDPKLAVTYINGGACEELYSNGFFLGNIDPGTIPGGAVLILKKSERILSCVETKSGEMSYSFVDEVFNGLKNNETRSNYYSGPYTTSWIEGDPEEDSSDWMSGTALNAINPDIVQAYEYFKNISGSCQNDYVYYGMTPQNSDGSLRGDVVSKIARFKISPLSFNALFDDAMDLDRNFVDSFSEDDNGGKKQPSDKETICSRLWGDGALEIEVVFGKPSETGNVLEHASIYDVPARLLFTLKDNSIKKERWGSTVFKWYVTWRYTIQYRDERTLVEKWYYPNNSREMPVWDLNKTSEIEIFVTEKDSGSSITDTRTVTTKKGNSTTSKIGTDIKADSLVTIKGELGWTATDEQTYTETHSITTKQGDDMMTTQSINYRDNYILGYADGLYRVHSYQNDRFTFTILPYRK